MRPMPKAGIVLQSLFTTEVLLPERLSMSLAVALYAMFIGLLLPNLRGNAKLLILAVMTAVFNSIFCLFMASSWALILATLLGAFIGVFFVDIEEKEDKANEHN